MDRKEAAERIKRHMIVHQIGAYPHIKLAEALSMAIEALQEPEIIRCKDCKYHCANYCTRDIKGRTNMFYMEDDDFCSYGMRGEEE